MNKMVRKAENKDLDKILILLQEVLELHAKIRPDIFVPGTTKYCREDLEELLKDELKPIYVAV
ncbi:MAG: GNAT family N-acetyltransferase, partial [Lachnospiraceae bacterium]|nr:GNAT family N-acetyltransferase [Lachnospiraceae bacterium]